MYQILILTFWGFIQILSKFWFFGNETNKKRDRNPFVGRDRALDTKIYVDLCALA